VVARERARRTAEEWARTRILDLNTKMTTRYRDPIPVPQRLLPGVGVLGALGFVAWLTGCSVVVDANRPQCSKDSDCTDRGAEFAGSVCLAGVCEANQQWSCDAVQPADAPSYKLTMHLQDAVLMSPLPGVRGQLCRKLDVTCQSPLGSAVADSAGVLTTQIEAGFDGYVQLNDPNNQISPALYFLTPPASGDVDLPSVPLASPFVASGIVKSAGGTSWLSDRGIVLLNAFDCAGKTAANISFSVGGTPAPDSFIFYLSETLPTTDTTVTDETGYGGLVNMPEGVTTISALLAPSQRKVGKISVLVRHGFISYSSVTPNSL